MVIFVWPYMNINFCVCALFFVESPVENLRVPDNSRSGSDGTQPFNRSHNGVANGFASQPHTDLGDSEVQEIFGNSVSTTTVQVLVEMNREEDSSTDAGQVLVYLAYNLVCVQQLALLSTLSEAVSFQISTDSPFNIHVQ